MSTEQFVQVPTEILKSLISMAQSHVDDINSGLKDGTYTADQNGDIVEKEANVAAAEQLLPEAFPQWTKSHGALSVYEVTAAGFDGAGDETDDLVFWIAAPSAESVQAAIRDTGATFCGDVLVCSLRDADYTLPSQAMALSSALLQKASEHRNKGRIAA